LERETASAAALPLLRFGKQEMGLDALAIERDSAARGRFGVRDPAVSQLAARQLDEQIDRRHATGDTGRSLARHPLVPLVIVAARSALGRLHSDGGTRCLADPIACPDYT
jgi:hypothetical protein